MPSTAVQEQFTAPAVSCYPLHTASVLFLPRSSARCIFIRDRFLVCMKEEWEDMKAHVPDFRQPHKSPDVPRHPQDMFDPVAMYAGPQTHKR